MGRQGIPLSEIDNNPTPNYDLSGSAARPDAVCAGAALRSLLARRSRLRVRARQRSRAGVHQARKVRQAVVRPPIDRSARAELWRTVGTTAPPCGTVYHLALSSDPQQRYVFVADGTDNMVWIYNRNDGTLAGSFGGNGRYAGQLHWIDAVADGLEGERLHRRGRGRETHPEIRSRQLVEPDHRRDPEGDQDDLAE